MFKGIINDSIKVRLLSAVSRRNSLNVYHSGAIRYLSSTHGLKSISVTSTNSITSNDISYNMINTTPTSTKTKKTLVILGSGWGAVSLVRAINPENYNIVVISPRNFFLFTPLLPSTTTGTVEYSSITEPIKGILRGKTAKTNGIIYYEAAAKKIDYENKSIIIETNLNHELQSVPFDNLVLAVGAATSTFDIPGVDKHAIFLKEISDSRKIRSKVVEWINKHDNKEYSKSLNTIVVGGGPSGVEVAAELQDYFKEDLKKKMPHLQGKFNVTLVEALPSILNSFDKKLTKFAELQLRKDQINLLTSTTVKKVTEDEVHAITKTKLPDGSVQENTIHLPYDLVIWATGITSHPIIKEFISSIKGQSGSTRGVLVDDNLQVKGAENVWAIGDCTTSQYPATAQVAHQQGTYLGNVLNQLAVPNTTNDTISPFKYSHKGSLAYVGSNRAVADVKLWSDGKVSTTGYFTYWFWRIAYLSMFVPSQNRFLVAADWIRIKLFGRNISSM